MVAGGEDRNIAIYGVPVHTSPHMGEWGECRCKMGVAGNTPTVVAVIANRVIHHRKMGKFRGGIWQHGTALAVAPMVGRHIHVANGRP